MPTTEDTDKERPPLVMQGPCSLQAIGDLVVHDGVVPLLAMGLLRRRAADEALSEMARRLGTRPWGVGLRGYLPARMYAEHLAALRDVRPAYAILTGGSPEQATALESLGIATFVEIRSPQALSQFLDVGHRRFVLRSDESAGRAGAYSGFTLWQAAVDRLLAMESAGELQLLFAGPIHDPLSATMISAIAVPLVARGDNIGILVDSTVSREAANGGEEAPRLDELWRGCRQILERAAKLAPRSSRPEPRRRQQEPLAIVGIGCMFPQSPDARMFWQNIVNRFDAIVEASPDRWSAEAFFDSDRLKPDRFYSKWGAFLDEIVFDPVRYLIPPAALASIEPIQLMALEVARQALEDAGYQRPDFPRARTAVIFAGAGTHDLGLSYGFRTMMRHWLPRVRGLDATTRQHIFDDLDRQLPRWTEDTFPGFLMNVVAGRVSNRFNLTGSNFVVDAACASSLAALQAAVEQLRAGTCDAALVGAVDGTNNPFCFMSFAKTHAMSPGGRSRPFDQQADGIGLGEGLAAMVVKRLSDAQRNGDTIHAVIRGLGSSSDGAARSLTAPYPDGQLLAIRRAYEDAGLSPAAITLVESHGTGTPVGDKIEVQALTQLFAAEGVAARSCAIGSIKSMIGHTKSVAGLASLVKTALAIEQRVLPPTIGVQTPNEMLRADDCPFYVSTEARPWFRRGGHPRRAGVSAFGFGGTNYHVILEERAGLGAAPQRNLMPRAAELFAWRAARREDLLGSIERLEADLADLAELDPPHEAQTVVDRHRLAELAQGVFHDRAGYREPAGGAASCRLAIVASSLDDLRQKLRVAREAAGTGAIEYPTGVYYSEASPADPREVCFLFPGQGSQEVNMLKDLVLGSPWAWPLFETADRGLTGLLGRPITEAIYPYPVFGDAERQRQQQRLNDTRFAQPALGLVEMFLHDLLARFGIRAAMVAGHSYGECVALCAAGVHTFEDLLKLSALRGHAVYEFGNTTPGGMATVFADGEATVAALKELQLDAAIANYNADVQTVIAGPVQVIDEAVEKLSKRGLRTRRIPVTAAFHTSAMDQVREEMDRHFRTIAFHRPQLPIYSNATAAPYPAEAECIRRQLGAHLTGPVLFARQLQAMYAAGARIFLEVGPGGVMTALVRRNFKDRPFTALPLDGAERDGWLHLGHVLGRLLVLGLPLELAPWFEDRGLRTSSTAEFFQQARARHQRKPTDWIVGPGGSRPWKKSPASEASSPRRGALDEKPDVTAANGSAPRPSARNSAKPPAVLRSARATNNVPDSNNPSQNPIATGVALSADYGSGTGSHEKTPVWQPRMETPAMQRQQPATEPETTGNRLTENNTADLMAQFRAMMTQWLDLQKEQQAIHQHFLSTQESVMLACLQGDTGPEVVRRPAIVARPAALAGPPSVPQPAPRKPSMPPAPVLPTPPVTASRPAPVASPATPLVAPSPAAVSVPPVSAPPAAAPAKAAMESGNGNMSATPTLHVPTASAVRTAAISPHGNGDSSGNGAPSVAAFREDLLNAISERTGYPLEMLDESLELEAGLGIDSIKTIEIFGLLSKYHNYLPGSADDQEESLAAFAKLRTIRDILNSYETNLQQKQRQAAEAPAAAEKGPAARMTVQPAEVPRSAAGQKKNSLKVTSS